MYIVEFEGWTHQSLFSHNDSVRTFQERLGPLWVITALSVDVVEFDFCIHSKHGTESPQAKYRPCRLDIAQLSRIAHEHSAVVDAHDVELALPEKFLVRCEDFYLVMREFQSLFSVLQVKPYRIEVQILVACADMEECFECLVALRGADCQFGFHNEVILFCGCCYFLWLFRSYFKKLLLLK